MDKYKSYKVCKFCQNPIYRNPIGFMEWLKVARIFAEDPTYSHKHCLKAMRKRKKVVIIN